MSQINQKNTMKYRVRFTGEMLPGFTQESAILSVAKAYSVPPEDIAKWFAPEGVTLRESATQEEISGLEGFFTQHGLKLSITEIVPEVASEISKARPSVDVLDSAKEDSSVVQDSDSERSSTQKTSNKVSETEREEDRDRRDAENFQQDYSDKNARQEISIEELQQTLSRLKVMLLPKDLEGFVPASLGKRFGAFLIDFLLFVVLFQLILSNILANFGLVNLEVIHQYVTLFNESGGSLEKMLASPEIEALSTQILKSIGPWYVFLYFVYFAVQERYYGATLGKRLFKIRIFSLRTGKNLTWNSIAIRTILFFMGMQFLTSLPVVGIFLFAGTVLWAIRDPLYRRTLYDMVAGTVVGSIPTDK